MARTWLITGSSRGFGRALAEAVLGGDGAGSDAGGGSGHGGGGAGEGGGDRVVATARRPEQLADLVERYGDRVRTVALDVTDAGAARDAVQLALDAFGSLDVVVNNAGYADSASIEDTSEEDFRAQIETNLYGVVNVTKAALPVLRRQRSGHFIQFSSIGGRVGGSPGMGAYQTAKFGVEGFSEVLSNEVRPFGVKVTVVEPGAFRTDWGGASMRRLRPGPDYEETVGEFNRFRESTVESWPGDPARAATAITGIVRHPEPPLRLLLGADALRMAADASERRAAEAERWADVTLSTDFPGSGQG